MVEGFWLVQFEGVQGGGGGVAVLLNGKLFGGDSGYTYIGTYQLAQTTLTARVHVHQFLPGIPNVLGMQGDFDLVISGVLDGEVIRGKAALAGNQATGLALKLSRQSTL